MNVFALLDSTDLKQTPRNCYTHPSDGFQWQHQKITSKEPADLYQVFLQVEGAQQLETLEARHADDPVGGQVKDLQTLLIVQVFDLLQLVSSLWGEHQQKTLKIVSAKYPSGRAGKVIFKEKI